MKATELRIGNYVEGVGMEEPIRRINDSIQYNYNTEKYELDAIEMQFFKPIPLTEEWLEKFGFKNQIGFYIEFGRFKDKTLELGYNNDTSETQYYVYVRGLFDNEFVQLRHDLKYVHHLQNLYFSLTGEELILK